MNFSFSTLLMFFISYITYSQISSPNGQVSSTTNPSTENIGIGTTTPTSKLEVNGDLKAKKGDFSGRELSDETFSNYDEGINESIIFAAGKTNPINSQRRIFNMYDMSMISPYNIKAVGFFINDRLGKERFNINIYEGSTTLLTLYDQSQGEFFKVNDYGDQRGAYLQIPKSNSKVIIGGFSNDPIMSTHKFVVKGSSLIQGDILTDSNIGIGTYNFTDGSEIYRLSVKGKIRAEEVKVYNTWADYVFNKDYDLPSLKEVENHIKENGHLINVPSAKEVKGNGLELGEMAKIQQEKIEELTLYIIEQNKINEKQNQEIEELKALVKKLLEKSK
ncbi:hypothetical protein FIA58_015190 [Flavobacterium jejuense]|uniref:Uncharacterized protein n=1 Tax=Flavobacterium jejuense TaxID=1544455 RepID=A0ABX0IW81_9FLAO|nr:hypothetical protein [Flavobacterium jejuense]NHN27027.1 hypothetical protein [Flavobacterium jejuense]